MKIKAITINAFLTRLISFCVLPLILLSLILTGIHTRTIQTHQKDEAESQIHNLAIAIDRDLQARIAALQVLANSPFLDEPPRLDSLYREAQSFRKSYSGHVILADLSTQMLLNTRMPLGSKLPILPMPKGFAAAPAVIENLKPAVGDMFIGPIANKNLVAVVVPVLRHGKLKALLLSIIDTTQYQQIIDQMAIPPGYSVAVLDGKGDVIAQRTPPDAPHVSTDKTNGKRFSINSQLSHWSAVLEVSDTIFYKPLVFDGFILVAAILIAFLGSIFGGKIIGRQLTQSVATLTDEPLSVKPKLLIAEIEEARAVLQAAAATKRLSDEELRKNEELYRSLFEVSNVGKSITLLTGEIKANKAFADLLGYSLGEIQNKTWQQITPPEEIEAIQKILALLLNGEQNSARFTKRYIHKNGAYIWADVSVALQRDQNGRPVHFITTIVDITDLKLSEKNLIEAESRYRALFENMTAGFVLFEVVQDEKGAPVDLVILAANNIFETTTGLKTQDVIGKRLTQVLPGIEKDHADWIGNYGKIALTGESRQFEQGSEHLGYYYSVIAYQAAPNQCAVSFVDITDRKKAEEERENLQAQLRQAQKMEAVGTLAGGVAHDYNNMLSVILGYTELTMEAIEPSSKLHANLTEVLNAAKRSTEITRQLLTFARKQTIEAIVLNLNDTIESMLKMIRRLIGEDIDLAWHPASNLWPVTMDPSQIDQILVNLCVNARDAIADVGKITIETENITIDEMYCSKHTGFVPGEFVLLAVSDNGCGMEKETVEKIFDPFFTTKELGRGTGLGVSIVYGIVKQNRGFINVYSEYGKGTTFKIYLQRYKGEMEEIEVKEVDEYQLAHGETVLIVEDDDSILQLCKRILEDLGYDVLAANTAEDAIKLAQIQDKKIHLLITDVIMPMMNGRVLATRIQSMCPEIKVLFMSGYTANVIAHHGILEKGIHFVSKPVSRKVLAAKVRKALD